MHQPPHSAYSAVTEDIAKACAQVGRPKESVTLVAVSKTHGETEIRPVLMAGHRIFGENRVQEAQQKWPPLKAEFPDVQLHLIGALQTNKAAEAVAVFDVIQSVDRDKLVAALSKEMARQGKRPKLLVQVNTGQEAQKAGISPHELPAFLSRARLQHNIEFAGLMCIPPALDDPKPHFRMLAELAQANGLAELSMGMSADYVEAITEGANYVRVGSAIFGHRVGGPP